MTTRRDIANALLEAALEYRQQGWPVPLHTVSDHFRFADVDKLLASKEGEW